ncbi:MAG: hypothetical protein IT370_37685 [Deltaproteobacteria bacterium]|mgnify:CR=1 FL=1|nr:hypothetical protein [Deltaproteobacteria bacterium]
MSPGRRALRAAALGLVLVGAACSTSVRYRLPLSNNPAADEGQQCYLVCKSRGHDAGERRACIRKCPGWIITEGASCKDRPEDQEPEALCDTYTEVTRRRIWWGLAGAAAVVLVVVVIGAL